MVIGIIGAMNEEIIELKTIMTEIVEEKLGGLLFFKGKFKKSNPVIFLLLYSVIIAFYYNLLDYALLFLLP